jgi:hypothetical protein
MLLRKDDRGVLAIGQPSHAWISGQLARAWGNQLFGAVEPHQEVCLAAEQHDVGWATRDLEPLYNVDTGLPRSFMEMPIELHLGLFTDGPRSLISQSRYAALLVSMHGWRLYARRDLDPLAPADAELVRFFLASQREFQRGLVDLLRADPTTAPVAGDALVERNSLLIWTWDYMSLALCLGWGPVTAKAVPTATAHVDLELTPGRVPRRVVVEPWPFRFPSLTVRCEGRRLADRYDSEEQLRAAFRQAPWETLELRLERGSGG